MLTKKKFNVDKIDILVPRDIKRYYDYDFVIIRN